MADSSWKAERERRANDIIKVMNPTTQDYVITWDKGNGAKLFRVPAGGDAMLPRYIAEKYVKEQVQKETTRRADEAVQKENEKRSKRGASPMDKTFRTMEQYEFERPHYTLTEEQYLELADKFYGGVVTRFGIDDAAREEMNGEKKLNVERSALDRLQREEKVIKEDAPVVEDDKKKQAVANISK